jgi:predicted double-glycine peptidase
MTNPFIIFTLFVFLAIPATPSAAGTLPVPGGTTLVNMPVKSLVELRFTNVVRQAYDVSCGAAALATILKYYYGESVTEQMIVDAMMAIGDKEKIQKDGFSLLEMKRYAERRGYVSVGYKVSDLDKLSKLKVPVISLVNARGYNHFVVIKGVADGQVFTADPAFGNQSRSLEAFSQQWNGVILVLLSDTKNGNSHFTLDPTLRAPVGQVIPLLGRILGGVRPEAGGF